MKRFAALYQRLDRSTGTLDKRAALRQYFADTPAHDAAWALYLLCGGKIAGSRARIASASELKSWIAAEAKLPDWLVEASHAEVGDLAETLALLLDDPVYPAPERTLSQWIEDALLTVANDETTLRRERVLSAWRGLVFAQRLLFNKLLTGALRVGVSQRLAQQALAELSGIEPARIAQRLLGDWQPSPTLLPTLLSPDALPGDRAQPYPFCLASPLQGPAEALGSLADWWLEWKWDGIRLQLLRRDGEVALWSRGEERLDGRFPEIEQAAQALPDDCVIDGELLVWREGESAPLPFSALQPRIQRRRPGARLLAETPVRLLGYDLLELRGEDLRTLPLHQRRQRLQQIIDSADDLRIALSPRLQPPNWSRAAALRADARQLGTEGLMLKRADSAYRGGRHRGDWWKWKLEPFSIDAVLLYAQAGHGRRSTLHTDCTFGLWDDDGQLVPIAKAYSGLNDREIARLDRWVRTHTRERYGPVRAVEPLLVFELGFEAVNRSNRHKSGLALRFPRILRWREDKPAAAADTLSSLRVLAR